jgi:hypothetical protein
VTDRARPAIHRAMNDSRLWIAAALLLAACLVPVDAGNNDSGFGCTFGDDTTCSPQHLEGAGTCRSDDTCDCSAGFVHDAHGKCVAQSAGGGAGGGSSGGGQSGGGAATGGGATGGSNGGGASSGGGVGGGSTGGGNTGGGSGGGNAGCGSQTCGPLQICVHPSCGGIPPPCTQANATGVCDYGPCINGMLPCAGAPCTPDPPFCVDLPVPCQLPPVQCGCFPTDPCLAHGSQCGTVDASGVECVSA